MNVDNLQRGGAETTAAQPAQSGAVDPMGDGRAMFRLASVEFSDKRILIVEGNPDTAERMAKDVSQSGGTVVATVADISTMLAALDGPCTIDSVMVDAQTLAQAPIFVPEWLEGKGMRLVVVTTWDEWFLGECEG